MSLPLSTQPDLADLRVNFAEAPKAPQSANLYNTKGAIAVHYGACSDS